MYSANESYQKRKLVVIAAMVIIALSVIVWLMAPLTHASELKDNYEEYLSGVADEINDGMWNTINAIFGSRNVPGILNQACSAMANALDSNDIVVTIGRLIMGVGVIVVVFNAFVTLFEQLQHGEGTMEMWAKSFMILAIGVLVIMNWEQLVKGINGFGEMIFDRVYKGISSISTDNGIKAWMNAQLGFGEEDLPQVGGSLANLVNIPKYIAILLKTMMNYIKVTAIFVALEIPLIQGRIVLLTILIEFVIRKAFFPLAIADVCSQGLRSSGVSYMKRLIGLWLRIAMCAIIALLASIMVGSIGTLETTNFVQDVMKILCMFIVFKTCSRLYSSTASLSAQVMGV